MRLDRFLANLPHLNRQQARRLLVERRVRVDGEPVTDGRHEVRVFSRIELDDELLQAGKPARYFMLHKPAGVLSAVEDSRQRTVLDLLPQELKRQGLSPVGRLDKDTEGLLLLTNDGALAHRLLSPKSHVDKVYYARVEGTLKLADTAAFAAGMTLGDGLCCLPAGLEILSPGEALVTLREGKFHQVKRMLATRGKPVTYLKRLSMGPLRLDPELAPGAFRVLTPEEKNALVDCH